MTKLVERLVRPEILTWIRRRSENREIWLVGGALRDHFLGRAQPDLDFVVDREAAGLARLLSEDLRGGYYSLDDARDAARVILRDQAGTLDFVRRSGTSIETDLRERDFTINALALPLEGDERLIDPLGGLQDLRERRLRPCAEDAVSRDPVRALRAVRLAVTLGLRMEPDAVLQVRAAAGRLSAVPAERVRDEFMKLLEPSAAGSAIRLLDHLGLLSAVCPELDQLPGSKEANREHSLTTLERLVELMELFGLGADGGASRNLALAEVTLQLGRFRAGLADHLQRRIRGGRQAVQLMGLAALYTRIEDSAQTSGSEAASSSAELAHRRALALRLSRPEAGRIRAMVLNHRRPAELARAGPLGDGAVYRFFLATGEPGIEVVLLFLAVSLAMLSPAPPPDEWRSRIGIARTLFEAWFERRDQVVRPRKLVAGDELANALGLQAGSVIGELLESIREAQAEGRVHDRESAIRLARLLHESGRGGPPAERPSELRDKSQ